MFRVPAKELGRLANEWSPFGVHMIQGFFQTVRVMDTLSREREQLIKLGEQSARLAHEINNPASAMARSVDALSETCDTLLSSLVQLPERALRADRFVAIDALRREIDPSSRRSSIRSRSLMRGDAVRLADGARCRRADGASLLRSPRPGSTPPGAIGRPRCSSGDTLEPGLEWVASTLVEPGVAREMKESTSRISELVEA